MQGREPRYPRSLGKFQSWLITDADCLDFLKWLRWPDGFVCPRCENTGGWRVADGSVKCTGCRAQCAVRAGTLFDRRRTPLTVWFQVCWAFATAKDCVSALSLQRTLQIGSYQTAWAMLHRLRSVLIRPGRELLSGTSLCATGNSSQTPSPRRLRRYRPHAAVTRPAPIALQQRGRGVIQFDADKSAQMDSPESRYGSPLLQLRHVRPAP